MTSNTLGFINSDAFQGDSINVRNVTTDQIFVGSGGISGDLGISGITIGVTPVAAQQAITDNQDPNLTSLATTITTTGAAAGALADGLIVGHRKLITMIADTGDYVLTPVNLSGGTTITFSNVGDVAELVWNGSEWVAVYLNNTVNGNGATPVLA